MVKQEGRREMAPDSSNLLFSYFFLGSHDEDNDLKMGFNFEETWQEE